MRKNITHILAGSAVLTMALLSGCGGTIDSPQKIHQPTDTTKVVRNGNTVETDWTWYVGTDVISSASSLELDTYFSEGIPSEVKHFQYFIDTDNRADTGFSYGKDSWTISGADYLLEDGALYKSTSTSSWSWSYVGEFDGFEKSVEGKTSHIHAHTSAFSSIVTANTINVTLEPFDANWGSTYSTISTQTIKLDGNGEGVGKTPQELIAEQINVIADIKAFVYTPDKKGAVVLIEEWPWQTLDIYDLGNPQKPLFEYTIFGGVVDISDVKMLGGGKVQFNHQYKDVADENDTSLHTVIYEYMNKKEITNVQVEGSLNNLKKRIEDAKSSWLTKYHITKMEEIDANLHLYLLHTTVKKNGKDHSTIEIYNTQAMDVVIYLQNTIKVSNINILRNTHTITYDKELNADERQRKNYIDNLRILGHYTYNYLTGKSTRTDEIIGLY